MASVYCTILMSFERYVRICHLCQLRYNTWLSKRTFGLLIGVVTLFPIAFYFPRFFELVSEPQGAIRYEFDCSNYTEQLKNKDVKNQDLYLDESYLLCTNFDYNLLVENNWTYVKEVKTENINIVGTWLHANETYQFVYVRILNTLFSTVIPLILLFYLNITTVIGKSFH